MKKLILLLFLLPLFATAQIQMSQVSGLIPKLNSKQDSIAKGTGFLKRVGLVWSYDNSNYLTSFTESDPIYSAWNKSTGISITKSQVSDFGTYQSPISTGTTSQYFRGDLSLATFPTLFSGAYSDLTGKPTLFSGSYLDLTNKPTIPAAQVQTDWNATTGLGVLLNKPSSLPASDVYSWAKASTKPSYSWSEIASKPTLLSQFTNDLGNYGGWITGINSSMVTAALGYTPYSSSNPSGYISSYSETDPIFVASQAHNITSTDITHLSNLSGSNSGDETSTTIKSKLGITTLSGSNTGDNAVNSLYSGLVSNATHTGDATGSTALTLATVNSNIGTYNNVTINAKGLATAGSNVGYLTGITSGQVTTALGYTPLSNATSFRTVNSVSVVGSGDISINPFPGFGTGNGAAWGYSAHPTTIVGYGITDAPWTNYLPLSGGILTGAVQFNANHLNFNQSGVRGWDVYASGGNFNIQDGDGAGLFKFNGSNVYTASNLNPILNQNTSPQAANIWINGVLKTDGLLSLNYAMSGTNAYHELNRNVITTENMLKWSTNGAAKWYLGQRSIGEEGFSLYNANNGTQALYFSPSGAATFSSSVTSASFSGSASGLTNLPINLTTTGTSGAATYTQATNTLNVPNYTSGVSSGASSGILVNITSGASSITHAYGYWENVVGNITAHYTITFVASGSVGSVVLLSFSPFQNQTGTYSIGFCTIQDASSTAPANGNIYFYNNSTIYTTAKTTVSSGSTQIINAIITYK